MPLPIYVKDPADVVDYEFRFTTLLAADADTITSHTVTVPTGIVKDSSANSTTAVTAWLSGGTAGTSYDVACKIVTVGGRTYERSMTIQVRDL